MLGSSITIGGQRLGGPLLPSEEEFPGRLDTDPDQVVQGALWPSPAGRTHLVLADTGLLGAIARTKEGTGEGANPELVCSQLSAPEVAANQHTKS